MNNFITIINDYMQNVTKTNDKRIMQEAINLIESRPIILDSELQVLNEVFNALKSDYTIQIIQDEINLDFLLAIVKQEIPIIENKHDINILVQTLKNFAYDNNISPIEKVALNFLDASEHIEENEVLLIQNIIIYLNNDWQLHEMETRKYNGEVIRYSRLTPTYGKKLIKT